MKHFATCNSPQTRKSFLRFVALFLLLAFINLMVGCNYYKIRTYESLTAEMSKVELQKYQNLNKYLILHSGSNTYHIIVDKLDTDKQILYCIGENTSPDHKRYQPDTEGQLYYNPRKGESVIKNEVHIFTKEIIQNEDRIEVPLSSVTRIDVLDHDSGRTIASYVFTILGAVAATMAIVIIVIILTKSSCPFVYVQNGKYFDFKGEIYGGAIYKPLQRDDYLHLKTLNESDSIINIRISNELKEIQYTDLANIIIAEHKNNVQPVIDNHGILHTIQNPVAPLSAILNNFKNAQKELAAVDSSSCLFEAEGKEHLLNELILTFDKPANTNQGKLIMNAKNSLFLDFSFTQFTKLFGNQYNNFVKKQNYANKDTLMQWSVNQGIPLSVYVKKKNQWQIVEHINTVGPLASRNICVPIDIHDIHENTIEVKLQCSFMFWEVDYAAMDFSENESVKTFLLKPFQAKDENEKDITAKIADKDGAYLVQPVPGNVASITYKLPVLEKGKKYDAFLVTNGYYNHVRDYDGLPDREYLMTFKQKGAFVNFAKSLQDKVLSNFELANSK